MSGIRDLPWLLPAPNDFRARCKALSVSSPGIGGTLGALAEFRLRSEHLHLLDRQVGRLRADGADFAPLQPLKLGLLGDATTELLAPAIGATALRYGFVAEIVQGPFGQATQDALDPRSAVNLARPDFVALQLDHRALDLPGGIGDEAEEADAMERSVGRIRTICESLPRNGGATVVLPTLVPPVDPLFGSLDAALPGAAARFVARLNRRIAELAEQSGCLLHDVAALASAIGLDEWEDATFWAAAKLPFAPACVPVYADHLMRLIAAARGKSRKCLVLDLDNTIWGGVIGDDGLEGIVLGNGDARGEAYLAVQRMALALRDRGILLAVASKNDDATAREPFRSHPEMLLRESHIAVFQANWDDKASNLRAIARRLDIGLDALVLLDDSPAERALVRQLAPEVAVPELPDDPAYYARTLSWAGYFEAVRFSAEDSARARQYEANAERAALAETIGNLEDYLRSLRMEMTVSAFDKLGRGRIAQLVNKTNQFNLTTRRYTEAQIAALESEPGVLGLQARLQDRFGDNGMIGVVICRPRGDDMEIDTWLMSCRVLNRRVEEAMLDVIVQQARARGFVGLVGRYIPTAKNGLVSEHYRKLGFESIGGEGEETLWRLALDRYTPRQPPIALSTKLS